MKTRDAISETRVRKVIKESGYECSEVYAIFDPDPEGTQEALFRGRFKGLPRGNVKVEEEVQPYTCHVWPDGSGFVTQSW